MASENSILGHYGITKLGMGSYGFAARSYGFGLDLLAVLHFMSCVWNVYRQTRGLHACILRT